MPFLADDSVLQQSLNQGLVSAAQAEAAGKIGNRQLTATETLERLVATGALSAWTVARLRAAEFGLAVIEPGALRPEPGADAGVPLSLLREHNLVPVTRGADSLTVAVADPLDSVGPERIAALTGLKVVTVVAAEADIRRVLRERASAEPEAAVTVLAESERSHGAAIESDSAPVVGLVADVIRDAIAGRASDIHWEPLETRFRVRYRVDGVLVEGPSPPHELRAAIVSRLKILANISIAQKRIPQDGRIQTEVGGRPIDLRVSTLPTVHGESVVMRVLDRRAVPTGLEGLGLARDHLDQLRDLVERPDGLVLVTGPTGSGKTATLYSCLQHLNRGQRKIITVEDPVELELPGINQVTVRSDIGLTFGTALRAILRQAPNVVMIGEIRDRETAEIAVNAALTGHLVLSTLHTNDAAAAITRLVDIGVPPFLLAATIRGVVAQRLVRQVCRHCGEVHPLSALEQCELGMSAGEAAAATARSGRGCPECRGTGYHGRLGIFEIVVINPALQQLIHERAGLDVLRAKARGLGQRTLRQDGIRKVSAGLTTAAEVVSITAGDSIPTHLRTHHEL